MTGFDNGPENGDFVRYIDALLAARTPIQVAPAPNRIAAPPQPSFNGQGTDGARPVAQLRKPSFAQPGAIASSMLRSGSPASARLWTFAIVLLVGMGLVAGAFVGTTFDVPMALFGAVLAYFAFTRLTEAAKAIATKPSLPDVWTVRKNAR